MVLKYIPEPELAKRLSSGDVNAFREIFDRFHQKIYHFAFSILKGKEESEEIVQNTFLKFWLCREILDPEKAIAPFLFTIARRTITDVWRREAKSESFRKKMLLRLELSQNDTEEKVLFNDLERITQEVLKQFSEQQRQVFKLSRYEGLSYEEIAERLHISKNTVKYHLVNGLRMMKAHYSRNGIMYLYFIYFYVLN